MALLPRKSIGSIQPEGSLCGARLAEVCIDFLKLSWKACKVLETFMILN
uniref:Uncharacterized protein n=1 Tax=Anguilla anguilla TaxID=7936 RepID=A0A0E9PXT8_ANGAN